MKKLFLLSLLVLPSLIYAQSFGSLTVFSENGDRFFLYLDGIKQNDVARSHIRVQDLPDLYYSAKIIFADSSAWPISKNNLYVSDGDDVMRDASYRLRRDKTGRPKLNFYSMVPVKKNFVPEAGMYVFHFGQPSSAETIKVPETTVAVPVNAVANVGSLHVFSPNGDKFFLFLNGVKQNDVAQSNVRVKDIPGLYYNAKIVFKDTKLAPIIKNNLFVSDGEDVLMDASYRVRRDKTGKPRLNFYSMKAVEPNFIVPAGMYVYDFGNPASGKTTVAVAATTTPDKKPAPGTKLITDIKITDVKVTDPATAKKNTVKSAPAGKAALTARPATPAKSAATEPSLVKAAPAPSAEKPKDPAANVSPESKKCNGWPMGKGDLAAAKKIIEEAGKDDAKLQAAQEVIASNCLSANQVVEFCAMFKSEKIKLAFAKYAYKYTIDRKNYGEVNKALTLEASKKELNKFINGG